MNAFGSRFWTTIKKYVTKESSINLELSLKISTNYSTVILITMAFVYYCNDFYIDNIDCPGRDHYGRDWNKYCWIHGTFLVNKALEKQMRSKVQYPGVCHYERGIDAISYLNYYNKMWLMFGFNILITYTPYMCLKVVQDIIDYKSQH